MTLKRKLADASSPAMEESASKRAVSPAASTVSCTLSDRTDDMSDASTTSRTPTPSSAQSPVDTLSVSTSRNSSPTRARKPSVSGKPILDFSTPQFLVHIYVGTGPRAYPFQIHKNLITCYSPYFRRAFKQDLPYRNGAQELHFKDDDKYVDRPTFSLFVNWLYAQSFLNSKGKKLNLIQYTKLYLLFTYFLMPTQAEEMMEAVQCTLPLKDAKDGTLVGFQKIAFSSEDDKLKQSACYKTAQHMDWNGIEVIMENMPEEMVGEWTVFLMRNCCALKGWTKGWGFAVFEMKMGNEIPDIGDGDDGSGEEDEEKVEETKGGKEDVSEEKINKENDKEIDIQNLRRKAFLTSRKFGGPRTFGESKDGEDKAMEEKDGLTMAVEAEAHLQAIRKGFGLEIAEEEDAETDDVENIKIVKENTAGSDDLMEAVRKAFPNGPPKKNKVVEEKTVEKDSVIHDSYVDDDENDVILEPRPNPFWAKNKRWFVRSSDDEKNDV